jgi:hypothetical protein
MGTLKLVGIAIVGGLAVGFAAAKLQAVVADPLSPFAYQVGENLTDYWTSFYGGSPIGTTTASAVLPS